MLVDILFYSYLMNCYIPTESIDHLVAYNIHFGKGFLLLHWKNLSTLRWSRENLGELNYILSDFF